MYTAQAYEGQHCTSNETGMDSASVTHIQGCGVGVLTTLGVGFFCPIPNVQFDHFLHYTPKLGIPVAMVQFLLKRLLQQISCCAPRFPLILAAKFHSLDVKESDSEILKWSETDILPPTPQPCPCQQETHLSLFQTKSSRDNV